MRGIEIFQKPSYREIRPMRDRPMRGPPVHLLMRGIHIFEKPCYREIRAMRGRAMRGPPV